MPLVRDSSAISACAFAPASPISAKPDVNSTTDFTFAAAASFRALTAMDAGTATIARSISWPTSLMFL